MALQYFKNLLAMSRKPWFGEVPMFDSRQDLSFIPDGGTHLVIEPPLEAADGVRVAFTFSAAPKYVSVNGVWYMPTTDFTLSGTIATLFFAPDTDAVIRGVV